MPLEDIEGPGRYISDLNSAWPLGTDEKREGDNHIRGVKNTLLNTLVDGSDNPISSELYNTYPTLSYLRNTMLPVGVIIMWRGNRSAIDASDEWAICDGTRGTLNLTNLMIGGSTNDTETGTAVGANEVTLLTANLPSHSHTSGTLEAVHSHTLRAATSTAAAPGGSGNLWYSWQRGVNNNAVNVEDQPVATTAADVSGATASTGSNTPFEVRPRRALLWFIQRIA